MISLHFCLQRFSYIFESTVRHPIQLVVIVCHIRYANLKLIYINTGLHAFIREHMEAS